MAASPRKTKAPRKRPTPADRLAAIHRATLEELAHADYGGLTYERVAARAAVNKTTLYRRWPTKAELVRAALSSVADEFTITPSTGTLRDDLLRIARQLVAFSSTPRGKSLMRLRLLEHPEPELAALALSIYRDREGQLDELLAAAVKRREASRPADLRLALDMLRGALHIRIVFRDEPTDDAFIARLVDTLLEGVARKPAR